MIKQTDKERRSNPLPSPSPKDGKKEKPLSYPPAAYTVKEFSAIYRLSVSTVWKRIQEGKIEARRDGGRTLIPVEFAEKRFNSLPKVCG